ncbi:DegT/DnrJ/EryC1/StrS family aminotransferase [Candidatus Pelagibacter sp.]|jgi:UDP-2-acetamido-2-deoxy-ribo-hexuluronate aminotransferase|nr:DegT/DnrJ/EryC1/StrS family aminotransferase [Candidatus Pelagibacter sp.]
MNVKFTNFPKEFKILKKELIKKFNKIGLKGHYVLGDELKDFEKNIQKFLKVKHVLGVGNWTEGTVMVLKALGYNRGDEIITVSNSFIATCGAIAYEGLVPKLVDVGEDLNIDVNKIKEKITKKTRAIMPVHLSGIPSNLDQLKKICKKKKLHLIEDAAHAFGTKYRNNYIGTIGDVGVFSLHPRKSFHVLGDGGLIVTNNTKLYKKILLLRNHGLKNREESLIWGTNSRLDNLQAGFGNIMLKKISSWNKKQLEIAKKYSKNLSKKLKTPIYDLKISNPTFHQYIVRTKLRDKLKIFLNKNKIDTAIHYPIPIHKQIAYKKQFGNIKLPLTEKFSKEILSLPINPYMTDNEVNFVIKKVNEFFKIK